MTTNMIILIVAVLAVLILGFLVMRSRTQRIEKAPREGDETYVARSDRPYVRPREGDGFTGEVAAAVTDVVGEVLNVDAHGALSDKAGHADNLQLLKGVGPRFVARLHELGVIRFEQLANFSETELAHLDERLGPFRGRLASDRISEQARYLASGDLDGFEEKFGKLGA